MDSLPIRGLVAAPHTPFDLQGRLNLAIVEGQAQALKDGGVTGVFVGGSTGESSSLTFDERDALAARWIEAAKPLGLRVVVHVGGTQVEAGAELARRAQAAGTDAIAALAPYYYKPRDVHELVACFAHMAQGAPDTPIYYYDIPALTGVDLPVLDFVEEARRLVPSFVGVKYTSSDLMGLQEILARGDLDVLFGNDEALLAGLSFGARGAVGSTYNLAPGVYLRLAKAFRDGDLDQARFEQRRSVQLVRTLVGFGFVSAAKATMAEIGVDVGPPRLPWLPLGEDERARLRAALVEIGFFDWRSAPELAAEGGEMW